jgi:hypothetical protein
MAEDEPSSEWEASSPEVAKATAKDEIKEALQTGAVRESAGLPEHLRHLPQRLQAQEIDLKRKSAEQEYELRKTYARGILWLLCIEMTVANAVFVAFAWVGEHWKLETAVIDVWLGATVVQVVGVVLVVTRHLFPERGSKRGETP